MPFTDESTPADLDPQHYKDDPPLDMTRTIIFGGVAFVLLFLIGVFSLVGLGHGSDLDTVIQALGPTLLVVVGFLFTLERQEKTAARVKKVELQTNGITEQARAQGREEGRALVLAELAELEKKKE